MKDCATSKLLNLLSSRELTQVHLCLDLCEGLRETGNTPGDIMGPPSIWTYIQSWESF